MSGKTREFSYYQNQINNQLSNYNVRDFYAGNDAWKIRGVLKLTYPVNYETVDDWVAIERIFHYSIHDLLKIDPSGRMLVLCPPYNVHSMEHDENHLQLEKFAEILFETYNIPKVVILDPTRAVAEAIGVKNALFLYLGDDIIRVTPVNNSHPVLDAVFSTEFGKRAMIMYMQRLLRQKGHEFQTSTEKQFVKDMVEEHARFAPSLHDKSIRSSQAIQYTLPDGNVIRLEGEQIQIGELFFNPGLMGREDDPIPIIIKKCYEKLSKIENGKDFEGIDKKVFEKFNRVLIHGPATFEGIDVRLINEMKKLMTDKPLFKVVYEQNLEFIGASKLGENVSKIADQIITKEEYDVHGPSIALKKYQV
ncbi:MAG: hypothetical protein ACTSXU_12370 [Promethearchaeota archaeon]